MDEFKITTILIDESSSKSFSIFNPNEWENKSKAIIQSCATELSLIEYIVKRLEKLCSNPKEMCQKHFMTLIQQWEMNHWEISKANYYAQIPEMHLLITGFFSMAKSLLDIIVQLLYTEGIVNNYIDGFHKSKDVFGGEVLNILNNNSIASYKQKAEEIHDFLFIQKKIWIDDLIFFRNKFVHIEEGAHQAMFLMEFDIKNNRLVFKNAQPPSINEITIDDYCKNKLENIRGFSISILKEIRKQ